MPRRPAKRAHDLIDLTGDDESETRQKRPAPNGHHNQQQHSPGQGGTSVYGSSSSQAAPSSTAEPDYLDLTQDDDGPPLELYGTFDGKIVGVRYYRGYASAGENVLCRREPNNQVRATPSGLILCLSCDMAWKLTSDISVRLQCHSG